MKKVSLRLICSFCVGIFCVVGCGQTGPLYLPDQAAPAGKSTTGNTSVEKPNASAISQALASEAKVSKVSKASQSKASNATSSAVLALPGVSSAATSSK